MLDSLTPIDHGLFLWINAGPAPLAWLVDFAEFMSEITPGLAGAGLLAACLVGDRTLRHAVLRAVLAMSIGWLCVNLIRRGFPLPRPAALGMGWQWLEHSGSAGFPSHHAAGAFACWAALAMSPGLRSRRWLVAAGLGIATAIAWSRLYLGVHFPKDVLAGGSIGWMAAVLVHQAWSRLAGAAHRHRSRRRLSAVVALRRYR